MRTTDTRHRGYASGIWPSLPFEDWEETQATLHRWMQIVGKVQLEATPFLNEWWNIGFSVTSTGMTTGLIPYRDEAFSVDFDFIDHNLFVHVTNGQSRAMPLIPRSVAHFYGDFFAVLQALEIDISINPMPVEIVNPVSCDVDHQNDSYDADAVHRWWRIQVQTSKVMQRYRTPFGGKSSPILFYWGSFDLTTVRYTNRPASLPEGAPRFMKLAEDQENFAVGFWAGNENHAGISYGEPAFYAYIFPEPEGFKEASVRPDAVFYHAKLGEFILPYEAVRQSEAPDEAILEFFQSAYDAAATLAGWDSYALSLEP